MTPQVLVSNKDGEEDSASTQDLDEFFDSTDSGIESANDVAATEELGLQWKRAVEAGEDHGHLASSSPGGAACLSPYPAPDLARMTYRQLQEKAKDIGLKANGKEEELRERVRQYFINDAKVTSLLAKDNPGDEGFNGAVSF